MYVSGRPVALYFDGDHATCAKYLPYARNLLQTLCKACTNVRKQTQIIDDATIRVMATPQLGKIYIAVTTGIDGFAFIPSQDDVLFGYPYSNQSGLINPPYGTALNPTPPDQHAPYGSVALLTTKGTNPALSVTRYPVYSKTLQGTEPRSFLYGECDWYDHSTKNTISWLSHPGRGIRGPGPIRRTSMPQAVIDAVDSAAARFGMAYSTVLKSYARRESKVYMDGKVIASLPSGALVLGAGIATGGGAKYLIVVTKRPDNSIVSDYVYVASWTGSEILSTAFTLIGEIAYSTPASDSILLGRNSNYLFSPDGLSCGCIYCSSDTDTYTPTASNVARASLEYTSGSWVVSSSFTHGMSLRLPAYEGGSIDSVVISKPIALDYSTAGVELLMTAEVSYSYTQTSLGNAAPVTQVVYDREFLVGWDGSQFANLYTETTGVESITVDFLINGSSVKSYSGSIAAFSSQSNNYGDYLASTWTIPFVNSVVRTISHSSSFSPIQYNLPNVSEQVVKSPEVTHCDLRRGFIVVVTNFGSGVRTDNMTSTYDPANPYTWTDVPSATQSDVDCAVDIRHENTWYSAGESSQNGDVLASYGGIIGLDSQTLYYRASDWSHQLSDSDFLPQYCYAQCDVLGTALVSAHTRSGGHSGSDASIGATLNWGRYKSGTSFDPATMLGLSGRVALQNLGLV